MRLYYENRPFSRLGSKQKHMQKKFFVGFPLVSLAAARAGVTQRSPSPRVGGCEGD